MLSNDRIDLQSHSFFNDVRKRSFSSEVSYANSKGERLTECAVMKGTDRTCMAEGRVGNSFWHQLQSVEKVNVIAQIGLIF